MLGVNNTPNQLKDSIRQKEQQRMRQHLEVIQMTVISIDMNKYTANVKGWGFEQPANLRALSLENDSGIITIPKIDSTVLVAKRLNSDFYIINYTEIDKIIIGTDSSKVGYSQFVYDLTNKIFYVVADKIYLNDDSETEPLVRGAKNADLHIDILNYIADLYARINSHYHLAPLGTTTPNINPADLVEIPAKITEINTTKIPVDVPNTKSTKNFTE